MIKPKVLKRALSLYRSGISREMTIAVIYDLCKDVRDTHNAAAFATIDEFYQTIYKGLYESLDDAIAENKRLSQYRADAKERKDP